MNNVSNVAAILLAAVLATAQEPGASGFQKKVDIGGYALHITCSALPSKPGPTVVLEAGLNQADDSWDKVTPEIAKFARVCTYDRAGQGHSDVSPINAHVTSRSIVDDMHRLLDRTGIRPPLVLVGHSFGGVNVRLYASIYPKDVVGMVLVDSVHEDETERWLAMLPVETRKAMEVAGGAMLLGGEKVDLETSMKQMKAAAWRTQIPLVVLARGSVSFDPDNFPPALRSLAPKAEELRLQLQKELPTRSAQGVFQLAEKSGHFIQQDQPEIVVEAVRRVWSGSN